MPTRLWFAVLISMKYNTCACMKRNIMLCATIMLIVACSGEKSLSLQERAEQLAESVVKSMLYIPDSYEAVTTRVDSAFVSVYNDPDIIAAAERIINIEDDNKYYWQLNDRKYAKLKKDIEAQIDVIRTRAAELPEHEFCGWNVYHRCRAKNIAGGVSFVEMLLITDKELESEICAFDLGDMEDKNFKRFQQVIDDVIDSTYYRFGIGFEPTADDFTPDMFPSIPPSLGLTTSGNARSSSGSAGRKSQQTKVFDDLIQEIMSVEEIDLGQYDDVPPSQTSTIDIIDFGIGGGDNTISSSSTDIGDDY